MLDAFTSILEFLTIKSSNLTFEALNVTLKLEYSKSINFPFEASKAPLKDIHFGI